LTRNSYREVNAKRTIEAGDEITTRENGTARSSEAIMADVNRAFENAIFRDPANWFWVHNRWKPRTKRTRISRVKLSESESESIAEP
jgi:KDO2-lipid IV(A) lauroyltransferase